MSALLYYQEVSLYDITPKGKSGNLAALSFYSLSIFSIMC